MFTYKCEIKSGPLLEVKYYKSFRRRNKKILLDKSINLEQTKSKPKQTVSEENNTHRGLSFATSLRATGSQGSLLRLVNLPKMNLRGLCRIFSSVSNAGQIKNKLNLSISGTANVANSVETGICTS